MKRSIALRVLSALGGAALLLLAVGVAAEGFFGLPLTARTAELLASRQALAVLVKIVLTLLLLALAWAVIVLAMPPRRPKQTDYVMQKSADGPIGVAVEAIRKKVLACVARHGEIASAEVDIRQAREGIVVLLTVDQVTGVSIPLSMGLLQKQVRQYVRDCTGVDVLEVRVLVDNRTEAQVESAFRVEDTVVPSAAREMAEFRTEPTPQVEQLRQMAEKTQPLRPEPAKEPAKEQEPEPAKPVEIPDALLPVAPAVPEELPEADKPLHQRVFGAEEEPLLVPVPPLEAEEEPTAPEIAEEPMAAEPAAQEAPAAEAPVSAEPSADETVGEDWLEPSMQAAAEAVLSGEDEEEV